MRIFKRLLLLTLVLALAAGGAAWFAYTRVQAPFRGFSEAERFVDIAPGTGPATIGKTLADAGVVRDPFTFRAALWVSGRARDLQAGEYRFDRPVTPFEVIDRLARGDVYKRLITFREGLMIPEMARVFEERGFGPADAFERAAGNASLIAFTAALGGKAPDSNVRVVGIAPGATMTDRIITLSKSRAKTKWGDEGRWQEMLSGLPLGRAGKPEEIADLAVFCASPRGGYLSGSTLDVDAGAQFRG